MHTGKHAVLDVVDDNNKVVGKASANHVYEERLNHRIVHVLIFNDKGELFLVQRSGQHKYCPGHWSAPSGNVLQGEGYEEAAQRELGNWLGTSLKLIKIHDGKYDHYRMRKFLQVFRGISEGRFILNKELAEKGRWFSVPTVLNMLKRNEAVHPELAHIMEVLYRQAPQAL